MTKPLKTKECPISPDQHTLLLRMQEQLIRAQQSYLLTLNAVLAGHGVAVCKDARIGGSSAAPTLVVTF